MPEGMRKVAEAGAGMREDEAKAALSTDPRSRRLMEAGGKLGNDEVQKRMETGAATRNELLVFVVRRLQVIREAQAREMIACQPREIREVWQQITDAHKDYATKPKPTRWHAPARIYAEATYHLCRGELRRGGELIQEAIAAERVAWKDLSALIDVDDLEQEPQAPGSLGESRKGLPCGECAPPDGSTIADDILFVTMDVANIPNRRRPRDPWWLEDVEEEGEEDGEGGEPGA